jgi:hypothetical protein
MTQKITKDVATKVLDVVDKGLCAGQDDGKYDDKGRPKPGHMCVEAAVCYAFGEKHGDDPKCVYSLVQNMKITINDLRNVWKNNKDRANGLRRLAIAQLGSKEIFKSNKKLQKELKRELSKIFFRNFSHQFAQEGYETALNLPRYLKVTLISEEKYGNLGISAAADLENLASPDRKSVLAFCEDFVQLLVKFKVPGTKFLYLTENKNKKTKKDAANRGSRAA